MGLDMFLFDARKDGKSFDEMIKIIEDGMFSEQAYWRKVNHIHKWFVDNVQNGVDNCGYYEVTKDDLEKLFTTCSMVRLYKNKSHELLPTQSGFFFGTTEYNERYFDEVLYTMECIIPLIRNFDFENYYLIYTSSW